MLKGVIIAYGIQHKCLYVNLTGHWIINMSLLYLLPFYFKMGIVGIWTAKVILEWYIFLAYFAMIQFQDWKSVTIESNANSKEKEKDIEKKQLIVIS